MRVDHPRDDEEPRAVDPLGLGRRRVATDRCDPPGVDDDVGAVEVTRANVDQPVCQDERGYRPLTVAASAIAPSGTGSASA